jgi:hypothetical protein
MLPRKVWPPAAQKFWLAAYPVWTGTDDAFADFFPEVEPALGPSEAITMRTATTRAVKGTRRTATNNIHTSPDDVGDIPDRWALGHGPNTEY